jgi:hypothetical protein
MLSVDKLLTAVRRLAQEEGSGRQFGDRLATLGRRLFFKGSDKISGVSPAGNPYRPINAVPRPDYYATLTLLTRLGLSSGDIFISDEAASEPPRGSVALIGGPVSNIYARRILGVGRGSPLLSVLSPRDAHILPITFDLIEPIRTKRFVRLDEVIGPEPDWPLIVEGQRIESAPGTDNLLITSLPNVYSEFYEANNRIVVISGAHEAGTRALELLLLHDEMLNRLLAQTEDLPGWQALIPVTEVEGERPLTLGKESVFPVSADFRSLHDRLRSRSFLDGLGPDDDLTRLIGDSAAEPAASASSIESLSPGTRADTETRHGPAKGTAVGTSTYWLTFTSEDGTPVHCLIQDGRVRIVELQDEDGTIEVAADEFDPDVLKRGLGDAFPTGRDTNVSHQRPAPTGLV